MAQEHRCDGCGAVSTYAPGFARRLTAAGLRTLCIACRLQRRRRIARLPWLLLLAAPLLFVLWHFARLGRLDVLWHEPGWVAGVVVDFYATAVPFMLGNLVWLLPAVVVVIVCHEAGHALGARLVGYGVAEVSLGLGPVVARGRVGGTRLVLRLLPLMGHTLTVPTDGGRRARQAVTVAAGPLVHAGVVGVAFLLADPSGGFARGVAHLGGLLLLLNLVPHHAGGQHPSDGLQLLTLLRGAGASAQDGSPPGPAYAAAVACMLGGELEQAQHACERGLSDDPTDSATEALLVGVLIERGRLDEARRRAGTLLTRELPPVRRAITQCNLAFATLLLDEPELVAEAVDAVEQAYATLPWEPAVQAAAGYVAITQGRLEDGLALVNRALKSERLAMQRAGMLAIRALGHARQGRLREAGADLRAARRLNPEDLLASRAAAELERCQRVVAAEA